jgi:hypothetical protein
LTDGKAFRDEPCRQQAISLIHYLATGQGQTPEYQLLLPKFLCGMPLNMPLDHFMDLTPESRSEAENLLKAVISHWCALKKTSPDGLRESFLQRPGKLEKRQSGRYLQIERHTLDILLDHLPWNLSMVKLPWMQEMLRVEWR